MKGSAPLRHDRCTSEQYLLGMMSKPLVYILRSDYARIVQKSNFYVTKHNTNI